MPYVLMDPTVLGTPFDDWVGYASFTEAEWRLAAGMAGAWRALAATGDPNAGSPLGVVWPRYRPAAPALMGLVTPPRVIDFPAGFTTACDRWWESLRWTGPDPPG